MDLDIITILILYLINIRFWQNHIFEVLFFQKFMVMSNAQIHRNSCVRYALKTGIEDILGPLIRNDGDNPK